MVNFGVFVIIIFLAGLLDVNTTRYTHQITKLTLNNCTLNTDTNVLLWRLKPLASYTHTVPIFLASLASFLHHVQLKPVLSVNIILTLLCTFSFHNRYTHFQVIELFTSRATPSTPGWGSVPPYPFKGSTPVYARDGYTCWRPVILWPPHCTASGAGNDRLPSLIFLSWCLDDTDGVDRLVWVIVLCWAVPAVLPGDLGQLSSSSLLESDCLFLVGLNLPYLLTSYFDLFVDSDLEGSSLSLFLSLLTVVVLWSLSAAWWNACHSRNNFRGEDL